MRLGLFASYRDAVVVVAANDFGTSKPLRYSRVSSSSAFLSSLNVSVLPSNTSEWPTRYEMFARCGSVDGQVPFEDVAGQDLRIVGANRVDEVLIVGELDRRQPHGLGLIARRPSPAPSRSSRRAGPSTTATCGRSPRSRASPSCRRRCCRCARRLRRSCARRGCRTPGSRRRRTRTSPSACRAFPATTRRRSSRPSS